MLLAFCVSGGSRSDGIALAIVVMIVAGLVATIGALITSPSARRINGIAMITAFHDFQPKDERSAVETVIELQAGGIVRPDASGAPDKGNERP